MQKTALGIEKLQFKREVGTAIETIYEKNDVVTFTHTSNAYDTADPLPADPTAQQAKHLVYSYFDNKPNLSVFDGMKAVGQPAPNVQNTNPNNAKIRYSNTENTLRIYFSDLNATTTQRAGDARPTPFFSANDKIRLSGKFDATDTVNSAALNGREFTISSVVYENDTSNSTNGYIQINTTGLGFPDADFDITDTDGGDIKVLFDPSTTVEAFFEGAENVYEDAPVNFASKKIVIREIGTAKQPNLDANAFSNFQRVFFQGAGDDPDTLTQLGLGAAGGMGVPKNSVG